jgi:hypothetical protein
MRDRLEWDWEECNRFMAQQFEDTIVSGREECVL